jgi:hypothetical protein
MLLHLFNLINAEGYACCASTLVNFFQRLTSPFLGNLGRLQQDSTSKKLYVCIELAIQYVFLAPLARMSYKI